MASIALRVCCAGVSPFSAGEMLRTWWVKNSLFLSHFFSSFVIRGCNIHARVLRQWRYSFQACVVCKDWISQSDRRWFLFPTCRVCVLLNWFLKLGKFKQNVKDRCEEINRNYWAVQGYRLSLILHFRDVHQVNTQTNKHTSRHEWWLRGKECCSTEVPPNSLVVHISFPRQEAVFWVVWDGVKHSYCALCVALSSCQTFTVLLPRKPLILLQGLWGGDGYGVPLAIRRVPWRVCRSASDTCPV